MKKIAILFTAILFSVSFAFGQIQQQEKELIKETKKEINEERGNIKAEKKDLKHEKKELSHLEGDDVSYMAKKNFLAAFGDVPNVQWKRVDLYDEATFMKDGKEMKAFYDFDSQLVGTTKTVTFADLPQSAQKEIKKEYKDYVIGPVIYFDNNDADDGLVLLYGIQFESQDNYFVELIKGAEKIVVQVLDTGEVFFYKDLK